VEGPVPFTGKHGGMMRLRIFELDIKLRIIVSFFLSFLAYILQLSRVSFIVWGPVLLVSGAFLWVKKVEIKKDEIKSGREEWKNVTMKEFQLAYRKALASGKLSTGNIASRLVLLVVIFIFLSIPIFPLMKHEMEIFYLVFDLFFLLFIVLLSGARRVWSPKDLDVKGEALLQAYDVIKNFPGFSMNPQLLLKIGDGRKSLPEDAKFFLQPQNAPAWMMGIQFQVSINSVQSKKYPYLYSVVILKKGNLERAKSCSSEDRKILVEFKDNSEVDVIVIRQRTTKTSGYYTNKNAIEKLVNQTFEMFNCIVKEK